MHRVKRSGWVAVPTRLPIQPTKRILQRVSVFTLEVFSQFPEGAHLPLGRPGFEFKSLSLSGVISPAASATLEVNFFCYDSHLKPDG